MAINANFNREERILILPHNTLRFVNTIYELDLMRLNGKQPPDFDVAVFKSVNRKKKDLHSVYSFGDDIEKKFKDNWYLYYDIAPRTDFYKYFDIMKHQKFIKTINVLFSDTRAKDSVFDAIYYDGTIEGLEKVIVDNKITALVVDDIDIIKELSDREKISLDTMSFFISKVGYNYVYNEEKRMLIPKKELYEVERKYSIEMAMISLFNFSYETLKKINNLGGSANE